MNIWIINEYAGSLYHGMEYRHYYLGKEFIKLGYNVTVISASYSHLFYNFPHVENAFKLESIDGINYLWVKVLQYKHAHDKKRVLKWLQFTFRTHFFLPAAYLDKPNVIIVSPMAPFPIISGYKWAKKFGARLIYEVKDIWPLTLIELGGYSEWHPIIKLMELFEKFGYKRFDRIVSVLPLLKNHISKYGVDSEKVEYIPNGVSLPDQNVNFKKINKIFERIPSNKFIVGYAGTIGEANALSELIHAANILNNHDDIFFLIIGNGRKKAEIVSMAKNMKLKNISFMPHIPRDYVIKALDKYISVVFVGWKKRNLYNYGISANKIFDYMLAGKPILHAFSGKGDIVAMANAGITVEAENPKAVADGILKLYRMPPEERKRLGENGRKYVLENHTYEKLAEKYIEVFKSLSKGNTQ